MDAFWGSDRKCRAGRPPAAWLWPRDANHDGDSNGLAHSFAYAGHGDANTNARAPHADPNAGADSGHPHSDVLYANANRDPDCNPHAVAAHADPGTVSVDNPGRRRP